MNNMDKKTKSDIETLLNVARPKLIEADKGKGSKLFNEVSKEFGPVACRTYLALDKPGRFCELYHDEVTKRVMIDPMTVFNRTKSLQNSEISIDDPEFWSHGDMIKTLCDYLDMRTMEE